MVFHVSSSFICSLSVSLGPASVPAAASPAPGSCLESQRIFVLCCFICVWVEGKKCTGEVECEVRRERERERWRQREGEILEVLVVVVEGGGCLDRSVIPELPATNRSSPSDEPLVQPTNQSFF